MKRQFVLVAALVACSMMLIDSSAFAQRPGGGGQRPGGFQGGPGGFGGGFGGGGGSLTELLRRDDVRAELDIVDDQVQDLEALGEKLRGRMQEEFARLREAGNNGNNEDRFAGIREAMQKMNEETEKEVGKILLPHQVKRLKQLQVQMRMQGRTQSVLLEGEIADELKVTDDQKEKIRAKADQVEQEMRQKLAELRKEAQDKLLAELSASQRAQFNEMVGDPFEFQRTEQRGFGGPQGGDGGRGGRPDNAGRRPGN